MIAEPAGAEPGRGLAERAREWFAILATLALSGFAALLALVLWRGGWSAATEGQRLGFLGAALILTIGLVGVGASWLWRIQFRTFEVKAGLVEVSAETVDQPPPG
jgi:hypothetical protein